MIDHNDPSQHFLDTHAELGPGKRFRFACHPGVPCFGACCSALTLMLTPYDALRLRRATGQPSRAFIQERTTMAPLPDSGLPLLRLRMLEDAGGKCPFLKPEGCAVYADRPSACRTYPLGRASRPDGRGGMAERFFVIREPHCRGFEEDKDWTSETWLSDQGLTEYNLRNDRYATLAEALHGVAAAGGGRLGPQQTGMAGLALYQPDEFQKFLGKSGMLDHLELSDERRAAVLADESACLDFAFDWLELFLLNKPEHLKLKEEK